MHQAPGGLAIRQGPWKLVFHRSGERELFNLEEDIGEKIDLRAEQQQVASRLTALMQKYIDRGRSTPGPARENEHQMTLFGDKPN